jgi:hypothetical protein
MRRLGISTAERQRAERPGEVWSWDFVADQTRNGSSLPTNAAKVWPMRMRSIFQLALHGLWVPRESRARPAECHSSPVLACCTSSKLRMETGRNRTACRSRVFRTRRHIRESDALANQQSRHTAIYVGSCLRDHLTCDRAEPQPLV